MNTTYTLLTVIKTIGIMLRQESIQNRLDTQFKPDVLLIENESHSHQVPIHSETHFKVVVVSTLFESQSRIARHRLINHALAPEFNTGLHALSLHLYTPEEWKKKQGDVRDSPLCQHTK